MIKDIYSKKKLASGWFSLLQQIICYEFEKIENDFGKKTRQNPKCFKKNWKKSKTKNEGGGTYSTIRDGLVFDSVGVNFSEVSGKFHKKFIIISNLNLEILYFLEEKVLERQKMYITMRMKD